MIESTWISLTLCTLISRLSHLQEILIYFWPKNLGLSQWSSVDFLRIYRFLRRYLTYFFQKEKTSSPKLLQRLQEWVSVYFEDQKSAQHRGPKSFGYSTLFVLKFTMVASVRLRGHFCLQIKSVDKEQVRTEDNEQLRIWMRWAEPVLWDISNKTPTWFWGTGTKARLANFASSSCFITSFGILSRISASSRFWHSMSTWVVGRRPQNLGSPGCLFGLCGLNSTGVWGCKQWDPKKGVLSIALTLLLLHHCFSVSK